MKKDIKISALLGFLLCLPVSGFIYGFIKCSDCGNGVSSILGRTFIGLVHIFLNIVTLGKPYDTEGGTSSTNIRIYVFITFVMLTTLIYLIKSYKKSEKSKK